MSISTKELLIGHLKMAGMNTLQIIKTIPKFDGGNFIKWPRSLSDILHIAWPFLSRIINGLESRSWSAETRTNPQWE